jgi:DNA-binding FrmR family transcriptional regulator
MGLCGATTRTGGVCKQPRMKGTSRCRIHGGSAPQVQRKAKELVARSIIERNALHYGQPRSISAVDALTEELHRTQGHVDWLAREVATRPQDGNLLAVYAAERGHLAKLAGQMVSGKLDEQRAILDEAGVEKLELAIVGILRDLRHDPATDYVRRVMARRLRSVMGERPARAERLPDAVGAPVVMDVAQPVAF